MAIRGWYVAPRPGVACDPALPPIHAPAPPCDAARHWLLTDPQVYGLEQGQLRRDPVLSGSVLNPLLPVDVPFAIRETWQGDDPKPEPVVVLGHFADTRVSTFRANAYFVIDALAWNRSDVLLDRVTRLTSAATEDPGAVAARIAAVSAEEALITWTTVVDATEFAQLEPFAARYLQGEFTPGTPIWIVRRLVLKEDELGSRGSTSRQASWRTVEPGSGSRTAAAPRWTS